MPTIWNSADLLCYNVIDSGAKGDGTTDDSAAIQSAINTAAGHTHGATVIFTAPTAYYLLANDVTAPSNVSIVFFQGAIVSPDAGKIFTVNGAFSAVPSQVFGGLGSIVFGTGYVNEVYPEWWGAKGDGVNVNGVFTGTNDAVAVQAAMTTGLPTTLLGSYLVASALTATNTVTGGVLLYSGTGSALTTTGSLLDTQIIVNHTAAVGLEIVPRSDAATFSGRIYALPYSLSNTGKGVYINATSGFVSNVNLSRLHVSGFKYSLYSGSAGGGDTYTVLSGVGVLLVGVAGGPISGSRGIYLDANTNGVGSNIINGSIENFDVGIEVATGAYGISVAADFEANTTKWSVGTTFAGRLYDQFSGEALDQIGLVSATPNDYWYRESIRPGYEYFQESHYSQRRSITISSGMADATWYRGSALSGTLPVLMGGFYSNGSWTTPQGTYLAVGPQAMAWGSAAPAAGSWRKGDVIWNTAPASGGATVNGWRCLTSGTFSTATDNTGHTDGSTAVITAITDTSDFFVGDYVTVSAGFSTTGPFRVMALTASTMTVDTNSNSVQSGVTVSTPDPTFSSMGVLP